MSINFFLNEFFYEDINKNINSSDDNFIINGIFLTKLKKNKYNFKTIVENYTIEEKRSLKKKKKFLMIKLDKHYQS